mmetsp:Transcript_32671/g.66699  ORF Transcript_32671/g.66699 Transcript_32671/m.66699 type:complete len:85 (-) Transcript_32671:216-470(-)
MMISIDINLPFLLQLHIRQVFHDSESDKTPEGHESSENFGEMLTRVKVALEGGLSVSEGLDCSCNLTLLLVAEADAGVVIVCAT